MWQRRNGITPRSRLSLRALLLLLLWPAAKGDTSCPAALTTKELLRFTAVNINQCATPALCSWRNSLHLQACHQLSSPPKVSHTWNSCASSFPSGPTLSWYSCKSWMTLGAPFSFAAKNSWGTWISLRNSCTHIGKESQ